MAAGTDPFASYLKRADDLFEAGDIVQAGQIWQAILKKKPDHETARAGLYKVKLYFDARATQGGLVGLKPPVPAPAPVEVPKPPDTDITRLLEQGCTLYDAGHIEDAITKWVQVLAKEPDNVLAKGYISGARRVLEQSGAGRPEPNPAPFAAASAPREPEPIPVSAEPAVDVERLLRDGCTLFDMGQVEDALRKWEEILAHDPAHALARAYVQDARKDLGLPPLEEGARPAPVPTPAGTAQAVPVEEGAGDERLEALIRDGVQLYDMGMVHEAKEKWQQVLDQSPGHRDAEAYLAMAQRDQHAAPPSAPTSAPNPAPAASEMSGRDFPGLQPRASYAPQALAPLELALDEPPEEPPAAVEESPKAVTPPTALTSGQQKPRKGFNLQEALAGLSVPRWVASPVFIVGSITGLVVLVVGTFYFMQHRKDKALRQAVESFRASAVAPVQRGSEVKDLAQTPESLRTAAQSAMGADPLMAYFHAQELARLVPTDASVAQLLERAKAGLATVDERPATFADFEKQFKNGELEAAEHSAAYLLSQTPDDRILRERTARLYLALAQAFAGNERWSDAEERLRRGQALFPSDRSWTAKLELLRRIPSMAKPERTPWIQLLG